jgi:hypothetical protein
MFTKLRKSGSRVISSFTFWVLFLLVCFVAAFFIMLANEPAIARLDANVYWYLRAAIGSGPPTMTFRPYG